MLTSLERGRFVFDIAAKLTLGNVQRVLDIDGLTLVETPAGSQSTSPGGLLALPSNMGRYESDTFAILPELDLKARLLVTDRLSVDIGYDLLFLTNVYCTGQQIDRVNDASQLSGALPVNDNTAAGQTQPVALLESSTLRAQGLTVGVSLTY